MSDTVFPPLTHAYILDMPQWENTRKQTNGLQENDKIHPMNMGYAELVNTGKIPNNTFLTSLPLCVCVTLCM